MIKEPAPSLASVTQGINRKYGASTIGTTKNIPTLQLDRIATGVKGLDDALGGGFPRGQMAELYGPPSSGKSLISLLTIKNAQQKGLECVYFDVENSYDPEWAKKVGVDTDKLVVTQVDVGEDIIDLMCKILDAHPGVVVVDSIAAMTTRAELESEADQKFMAPLARLLSYGLKRVNHHNKETVIIFINQLREKITPFGGIPYRPGGKQLPHLSSIHVEVKKDSQPLTESGKKTDTNIIGQTVNYKITRNKTAIPYKFGSFRLLYENANIEE
jgi:recombination protein RecA